MTISELITYLEEAQAEYGNIEVRVQYRDEGGNYTGYDECLYNYIEEDSEMKKKYLVL